MQSSEAEKSILPVRSAISEASGDRARALFDIDGVEYDAMSFSGEREDVGEEEG